jgi:hypothetical protein
MDLPEQERLFFDSVGRAFGQWQHVEMQLFRVTPTHQAWQYRSRIGRFSFRRELQYATGHDRCCRARYWLLEAKKSPKWSPEIQT